MFFEIYMGMFRCSQGSKCGAGLSEFTLYQLVFVVGLPVEVPAFIFGLLHIEILFWLVRGRNKGGGG